MRTTCALTRWRGVFVRQCGTLSASRRGAVGWNPSAGWNPSVAVGWNPSVGLATSQDCEVHSLGQTTWRPEVSVMESLLGGPEVLSTILPARPSKTKFTKLMIFQIVRSLFFTLTVPDLRSCRIGSRLRFTTNNCQHNSHTNTQALSSNTLQAHGVEHLTMCCNTQFTKHHHDKHGLDNCDSTWDITASQLCLSARCEDH